MATRLGRWVGFTCTWIKEAAQKAVLFISSVANSSYKSFLKKFFEHLETRCSVLEPENSVLNSWKYWVLRIEFQVETVNLHLTSTVCYSYINSCLQEKEILAAIPQLRRRKTDQLYCLWINWKYFIQHLYRPRLAAWCGGIYYRNCVLVCIMYYHGLSVLIIVYSFPVTKQCAAGISCFLGGTERKWSSVRIHCCEYKKQLNDWYIWLKLLCLMVDH